MGLAYDLLIAWVDVNSNLEVTMRLYDDRDDDIRECPDCGTPTQFGQLCGKCTRDEQAGLEPEFEWDR